MNADQGAIIRALIACSYSGGFDTAYPLDKILEACRLPPETVLYDEDTESGLLWQLGCDGFVDVQDHGHGQYASIAMESLSRLEAWSRKVSASQDSGQEIRRLPWTETFDDDDNSIWEAPSAFLDGEDGAPFMWRLRQVLMYNAIWWVDHATDGELIDGAGSEYRTLGEAMNSCENANDCIIQDCLTAEDEVDGA